MFKMFLYTHHQHKSNYQQKKTRIMSSRCMMHNKHNPAIQLLTRAL